nr:reverse transcriptase domain-containing protein [Tanacetum cinerariifolium]
MSAMANTTPLVTTVTKTATNPRDTDTTPRVNIQEFCEEYYVDILPIIMDKVCQDRRKDVHTRLDFEEGPRERARKDSRHSNTRAKTTKPEQEADSRDTLRGRNSTHGLNTSRVDCLKDREGFQGIRESYDDSFSHSCRDGNRSRRRKRRDTKSLSSSASRSDSRDEKYRKSKSKRHESTDEDDLMRPSHQSFQAAAQVERWAMPTWCHMFNSTLIGAARKYFKDPVEIYDIKQRDGETIEDFMKRFKAETGRMKGDPECMQIFGFMHGLKRQIEELVRAEKLSHLIKEIKQGRDQSKTGKIETTVKDKPTAIYMVQSWQRIVKQKVTQSFERVKEISFPPLTANNGMKGPLIIEAEMGRHKIHRMYMDGATTSLTGFSGDTIWPLGQLRLLVIIGDATHSIKAWINFMIVKSLSPYNDIIGRPGLRAIQAVPFTVHEMLKFPVKERIAHPITVITGQPIKQVMSRPDVARRLQKWSIMLEEHNITYKPRTSVKRQILADFLTEMPGEDPQTVPVAETQEEPWTLFTDGSSCVDGSASNNEAEYEALVAGMQIAARIGLKDVHAEYVMREIHEGSCSIHVGPRSVVAKAIRLGYYWLTMHKDVRDMIRKCSDCQIHRPITRHPQQPLTLITALWPFYKWGIDIAGPFPERPGKVKFLIVAMDYFTKRIEAKAVATITGRHVKKFVWDNIVCCFGIPGEIVSDNGKQFSDNPFKDWCDKLNITQRFVSVKHPQSNRLVERVNRSLGEGIKSRLGEGNKNWIEELPHVLRAHRTMIKSRHGDTPFSLTYGTEAVIPTEFGMPTYCTAAVDVVSNNDELRLNLDLVRGVTFKPGDFVYRSNDASHAIAGGKLGPKWEGPYEVIEALVMDRISCDPWTKQFSQERGILQITNDVTSESQLRHGFQL